MDKTHTQPRSPRRALCPALLGLALSACGGGAPPPTMQGRDGMLGETAIAKKCEEASKEHLKPFVIEWDATDLASFEAKASQGTVLVKYEGCELEPLYECSDRTNPTLFGSYGSPHFTSGAVQGFDVKNEGELFAELPLGAAKLSGRLHAGETLHLKYFVSGVATSSREALYRDDLSRYPGCAEATHFVWAYNLGAFELSSRERSGGEAEASAFGAGAGAKSSREKSQLGNGGDLGSCTTQDQRACRTPIRLALRPVRPGAHPAGATAALGTPAGGRPPGQPDLPPELAEKIQVSERVTAASAEANKLLHENKDGVGCLRQLETIMQLDPRRTEERGFKYTYAACLMVAGKCDDGKKAYREMMAAEDVKRLKTDEQLDRETREMADRNCPSSTAKTDEEFAVRASGELVALRKSKDGPACRKKFEELEARIKKLDAKFDKLLKAGEAAGDEAREARRARGKAVRALDSGVVCVAEASGCAEGLELHKRAYRLQLQSVKPEQADRAATESWDTRVHKFKQIECK